MKILLCIVTFVIFGGNNSIADINNMELRGKGDARYLGFIKVYEATLFTYETQQEVDILDRRTSRCLELDYALSLSAKDIIKGANTILARQHKPARLAQIQTEIDRLHMAFQDVKEKDRYRLCYDSGSEITTLLLNDQELVSIKSADFGTVYFGIWLGPTAPIDEKLRDKLVAYDK